MGKIDNGVYGGMSGKAGNLVGGKWRSTNYLRAYVKHVKNPKTEAQIENRARFVLAQKFARSMAGFLNVGYMKFARNKTCVNAAVSSFVKFGVAGEYPDIDIDYENIRVSVGPMVAPDEVHVTVSPREVKFTWEDNTVQDDSSPNDIAMALVYDKEAQVSYYTTRGSGTRGGVPTQVINIPARSAGHKIETYLAFRSPDGKKVSDSVFCGEFVAQ